MCENYIFSFWFIFVLSKPFLRKKTVLTNSKIRMKKVTTKAPWPLGDTTVKHYF